jgi:alpha-ketoglutarate-dependent taurine dioxygenase
MSEATDTARPSLRDLARRKAVGTPGDLVRQAPLRAGEPLPLTIAPAVPGVTLKGWLASNRDLVAARLVEHGGILFRGFPVAGIEEFQELIRTLSGELMEYTYRSTPRTQVRGEIYTSTEYPADEWIPMHNEMSYSQAWPLKIWFHCARAAESGGETPIADSRRVYRALAPALRRRFEEQGVMYVRNYGEGLDLSWTDVFQTSRKEDVEAFCRATGIQFEWRPDGRLRTVQVCQAVADHPVTGERVWFNQAHLFHITSLKPEARELLLSMLGEEDLPRNTYYGDGSPIEPSVLDEIQAVYRELSVLFPWEEGDVLLLDNMLTAHGRAPFAGPRKILVGMAEPGGAGRTAGEAA